MFDSAAGGHFLQRRATRKYGQITSGGRNDNNRQYRTWRGATAGVKVFPNEWSEQTSVTRIL